MSMMTGKTKEKQTFVFNVVWALYETISLKVLKKKKKKKPKQGSGRFLHQPTFRYNHENNLTFNI
jgi:hypothetical protein